MLLACGVCLVVGGRPCFSKVRAPTRANIMNVMMTGFNDDLNGVIYFEGKRECSGYFGGLGTMCWVGMTSIGRQTGLLIAAINLWIEIFDSFLIKMSCVSCSMTMVAFISMCVEEERLLEWLRAHGVLRREMKCGKCGAACSLKKDFRYVCGKTSTTKKGSKVVKSRCNFSISARRGTWFEESKLSIKCICLFTMYWAILRPPRNEILERECGMGSHAVVDWANFCRELCVDWCFRDKAKLGGPGKIVEIDEAKIGKRKYNRGRVVEGKWVFGGFERDSKKLFVVGVENRSAETLLQVIKEWILPGTTVISDCWKAYNCLASEGFVHFTVNHSVNFVDPDSGAHTQNIERAWREVRSSVPRYGRSEAHYLGYLCEFLWKRSLPDHRDRVHAVFKELIARLYDPYAPVVEEAAGGEVEGTSGESSD